MQNPPKPADLINFSSIRNLTLCFLATILVSFAQPVKAAEKLTDAVALADMKEAKVVFLLDFKDAANTADYLQVIEQTHAGFKSQGVKPDIKIVIIGKTVEFLTTKPKPEFAKKDAKLMKVIASTTQNLDKLGVRVEVCGLATEYFKVENKSLMPGLKLTANGFVALAGWQNQGYQLIPVF